MAELDELREKVARLRQYQKAYIKDRRKASYRLAKELGFDTYEAMAMAGWSKGRIRELAKQLNKPASD